MAGELGVDAAGTRGELCISEIIVEIEADTAIEYGRHRPRLLRIRTDLTPADLQRRATRGH